jgi:GTPase SAR1 family protein
MLRAKEPTLIKKRLKAFIYGREKVGKTTCCIQFPKSYVIDTENGAIHSQYIELLKKSGSVILQTGSFDEVMAEVKALKHEKHDFKTIIIDSLTLLYANLVSHYQPLVDNKFAGHYQKANQDFSRLMSALLELDMNVLLTAHAKTLYDVGKTSGKVTMETCGDTYDCYKKTPYLFDLILEIRNIAGDRRAFVKGSRLQEFKEGENFEFSYKNFCEKYDIETLERETVPVELASLENRELLKDLINVFHVPKETYNKWLDKCNASKFAEMPQTAILKCIKHLESQLPKEK